MIRFTIIGRPVPKKNSARILRRRDGTPFVMPASRNIAWTRLAVRQLQDQFRGPHGPLPPITGPVSVAYAFHLPDRRWEPDADNLMASVNDALQKAGILANDKQIRCGTFAKHFGATDPRVDLVIHAAPLADLQPVA